MTLDLSQITGILLSLAATIVSAAIPILVPAMLKRLHIANDAALTANLQAVATAAAGLAYQYAAGKAGGLGSVNVHDDALAIGTAYVIKHLPDTLAQLHVTPEIVSEMVSARLGVLLASDPTVSAGVPAPGVRPAAPIPVSLFNSGPQ